MRLGAMALLVAACYHEPSDGPCSIHCLDGACPSGLSCERTFCVAPNETCSTNFKQITAGDGFTCAIDTANSVWCWGRNDHHQIDATADHVVATPRTVDTAHLWDSIDAGGGQLCGIAATKLYCWGQNDRGEIDDAIFGDVTGAHAVDAGVTAWTAVSAGVGFTCAIGDGNVYCWGDNTSGQLGDGTTTPHGTPHAIASTLSDWTAIVAGETRACAISAAHGAFCWGDNTHGALGPTPTTTLATMPVAIEIPNGAIPTAIATTADATCAVAGGQLYCWGYDYLGELGDPAVAPRMTTDPHEHRAPALAAATMGWTEISAGHASFCGHHEGTVACWGHGDEGALGGGVWIESPGWHDAVQTDAAHVTLGYGTELACTTAIDGTARCWGDNRYGQLGDGMPAMQAAPVSIAGGPWSRLTANTDSACALAQNTTFCWGSTQHGEATGVVAGSPENACVSGDDCDLATPRDVMFASNATQITSGNNSHCALHGKTVTCWGRASTGEIGTTDPTQSHHDVPVPDIGDWDALLEYRGNDECAHSTYDRVGPIVGTTYCWGADTAMGAKPTKYALFASALSVEVDRQTTCFIDSDGDRECKGDDAGFEFGNGGIEGCGNGTCDFAEGCGAACSGDCDKVLDGVLTCSFDFAHVAGPETFTELAGNANNGAFCAVTTSGTLDCWGDNSTGLAMTTVGGNVTFPSRISDLAGCTSVTMGRAHVCAACGDSVTCWGSNDSAQLGIEASPQIMPPRMIDLPRTKQWVTVRALTDATCAISKDGDIECWGAAAHGGLGSGGKAANLPRVVAVHP